MTWSLPNETAQLSSRAVRRSRYQYSSGRKSISSGAGAPPSSPVRGDRLSRLTAGADSSRMASLEAPTEALRDRALALAAEFDLDPDAWYLQVLAEGRTVGEEPEVGALVRAYWELQRVSGRADLRAEWRSLADRLWQAA